MKSKVVFITGGAGGIGQAIARLFAGNGDRVIIADSDIQKLAKAEESFREQQLAIRAIPMDLTDENQVIAGLDETCQAYGNIDVLVNNAGFQHIAAIEEFPTVKFRLMMEVMLIAPFITTRYVFPRMKEQRSGRIINMASINGLIGFAGKAGYNSAKHGLIGLTRVSALEGAEHNITVNAVCPGYVDTELVQSQLASLAKERNCSVDTVLEEIIFPLVPQRRLLQVDEIANYVLFLASEKAGGITGQAVVIDGGYTAQ